ncbi:LOW QUALITY PROTEIN: basic leucine zipper 61-like [Prosopis cineraria]|uniref:LOW QUALITY PROTEIN: basic leucine zipper 61-like n=1 Tax=Prosopis cineraria TaxID=364024 RepID=UPI00240ED6C4|nr:LOW QUALITY PROTEIN: basic leucine zipper 61-like [Prosopis cineraria]
MAQLPPKVPTMTQNWPSFPHQKLPTMPPSFINPTQQFQQQGSPSPPPLTLPTWVDEFLDFSSARRGAHRRSASDSIAYLDTAFLEECRKPAGGAGAHLGFDRLDDDQLMSMFSDDIGSVSLPPSFATASNPSTPSDDQNSNHEEKPMVLDDVVPTQDLQLQIQPKNEPGEVESACKNDGDTLPPRRRPLQAGAESIVDPKRVKRILANRQSAQRSRVRKLQYISDLERSVSTLQTEVSALSPRVAFLDHQRLILNVDNSTLKQRIAALAQDKIFKDAHHEALKKEIERLRQIYHQQQNLHKMDRSVNNNNNGHPLHSPPQPRTSTTTTTSLPAAAPPLAETQPTLMPPRSQPVGCLDKEQLMS